MSKNVAKEKNSWIDAVFRPIGKALRFLSLKFYDLRVRLFGNRKKSGKPRSFSVRRRNESIFYYALVAFPLIQFAVFYIGVNVNSILLAFKDYSIGAGGYSWTGLSNFQQFFSDLFTGPDLRQIAANSFIVYGVGLLVGMPLALMFSFYLYKKLFLSGLFKVLLFLPSIISSVVMVLMYKYFVDRGLPGMMQTLFNIKMNAPLSDTTTRFAWIIFYNIFVCFGTNVIMYTSSMSRIPVSVVEYAKLDGIGFFREFWSITLPLIYPTLTTFLVVGIAGIFTNQANIYTFLGLEAGSDVSTFGYFLFSKVIAGRTTLAEYPYASAAGIVFTFVAVPVTLLGKYLLEKLGPSTEY